MGTCLIDVTYLFSLCAVLLLVSYKVLFSDLSAFGIV